MRIAIVGPFFWPQLEGVEKVMLNHARHLARRGHEVHVVASALQFPKGQFAGLPKEEMHEGFTIHRMRVLIREPNWRFFYLANGGVLIRGIGRTLRRIGPEVLHAHQIAAPAWAFAAAWYARTRGRKFFYSPHHHPDAVPGQRFRNLILHGLNRLPLSIARRVFHLTRNDYEPFAREYPYVPRGRFTVLPNGVDPAPLAPIPAEPGTLRLLFVGRVDDRRKGFDLLRRAFAETRRPGWVLTVIGRISDATRDSLAAEFGPAVRVLGPVDEAALECAYAACDLFVMPSRYEGFGMPYLEAMRYGAAVIGTAVGGVPEVVPPGTGVLLAVDDGAGLAATLVRLGNDPAERARLGGAGRAWAARFHWDRIVDVLEKEYATA
ncbi:MAG: glycosyltransferase family 4 protein [Acetobacteraceae bacterium]